MRSRLTIALLVLVPAGAAAQIEAARATGPDSVVIAAGSRYQGSGLSRFIFGSMYRDLWTTPIKVPVIDLRTYAGGIRPFKLGGGNQTKSLRFMTADGSEYVFRLVDKDKLTVPAGFKGTILETSARNQVSAHHPAAAIVAAPLLEAAGVLHVTPIFATMPNDTSLGEYRADFAGKLGTLERYPNKPDSAPGFAGADDIVDSDKFPGHLNRDPGFTIDTRAFLKARLMDMFLNDWDRHGGQWKWARFDSASPRAWEPIPRDRDKPFVSYGGVVKAAGMVEPTVITFSARYPRARSLTANSLEFDRRLLSGLEKPVYDSIAQDLRERLTDSVIDAAVAAMPVEYQGNAPWLAGILKARRDQIPAVATGLYLFLATIEDLHATDSADRAVVTRHDDGSVEIALASGDRKPYFRRRFNLDETDQIRLYLHGGNDTAVVTGSADRSIPLWIIGGNGYNALLDSSRVHGKSRPTGMYDAGLMTGVGYDGDSAWNRRPWVKRDGKLVAPGPDRGGKFSPGIGVRSELDLGLLFRVTTDKYTFGFRRYPYLRRLGLSAEYATEHRGYRFGGIFDMRMESSPLHLGFQARLSELEVVNFHGRGNSSPDAPADFYEVQQRQWQFRPVVGLALGSRGDVSLGPVLQVSHTDSVPGRSISATRPYGFGNFGEAGLRLGLSYDGRDRSRDPRRGISFDASGSWYPAIWDVSDGFGAITGTATSYLTFPIPAHPTLSLRAGARKVFGTFPFQESAFIGGRLTVRNLEPQRYAGDASVNGSADLRVSVATFPLIVPLNFGVYGFADAGRVYDKGSSPGGWHTATGFGVWLGILNSATAISVELTDLRNSAGVRFLTGVIF